MVYAIRITLPAEKEEKTYIVPTRLCKRPPKRRRVVTLPFRF